MRLRFIAVVLVACALAGPILAEETPDPATIIRDSFDHYRGLASESTVEMVIHRPTWERSVSMDAWTKGTSDSLIRITAPAKDEGNGTLKKGYEMWTYNPKVDRVIKLPPALMSQSWMGSDFSNNDLAKSDSILNDYTHTLAGTEQHGNQVVFVVKSMPKPGAPVVWGMQVIKVREDHVMLSQEFFDEDMASVKLMTVRDIQRMAGRMFPKIWQMQETGKQDQYTLLRYISLEFLEDLPDSIFTLNALRTRHRR